MSLKTLYYIGIMVTCISALRYVYVNDMAVPGFWKKFFPVEPVEPVEIRGVIKEATLRQKGDVISSVTPEEIRSAIKKASPYQKKEIAKAYEGLHVSWVGYFYTILEPSNFEDEDPRRIVLLYESPRRIDGYCFSIRVFIDDYPQLKVLKENASLTVTGKIIKCTSDSAEIAVAEIDFERK